MLANREPGGSTPVSETTTRSGVRGPAGPPSGLRAARCGSSARSVPAPTSTASHRPRRACTSARLSGPLIQRACPVRLAVLPSSVIAHLTITHGRPVVTRFVNGAIRARASPSRTPTVTSTSAARSAATPPPAVCGAGSAAPITTRATPARSTASVQGGVLPWCRHGSSVTNSVAPRAASSPDPRGGLQGVHPPLCGPPKARW